MQIGCLVSGSFGEWDEGSGAWNGSGGGKG